MKKLFAIFALVGVLLQTFNQVVIVAQFYSQKEYIAKNLCENKAKPQLHCDGKCCLKKKLAKQSKEQAPTSNNNKNEQVVNLFFSHHQFSLQSNISFPESVTYFSYNELKTAGYFSSVFHPPSV